jgi:undecaprenyl-diphosphatase
MDELKVPDPIAIGIAQAVAIIPGISRSGSTIGTGLLLGLKREDAARFAFLLAIPALFGASVYKLPDLGNGDLGFGAGLAGLLSSALFSYVAIAGLIKFLRNNTLYPFAIYCIVMGPVFYLLVR